MMSGGNLQVRVITVVPRRGQHLRPSTVDLQSVTGCDLDVGSMPQQGVREGERAVPRVERQKPLGDRGTDGGVVVDKPLVAGPRLNRLLVDLKEKPVGEMAFSQGSDVQKVTRGVIQAAEPRCHRCQYRSRNINDGRSASHKLFGQHRVALTQGDQACDMGRAGFTVGKVGDERGQFVGGERLHRYTRSVRQSRQRGGHVGRGRVGMAVVCSDRDCEKKVAVADDADEVVKKITARPVDPLQVLDDQPDRAVGG